jgi:hypothetical protein
MPRAPRALRATAGRQCEVLFLIRVNQRHSRAEKSSQDEMNLIYSSADITDPIFKQKETKAAKSS